jgi:uncharacterized protein YmfQ (DUF2313 family)
MKNYFKNLAFYFPSGKIWNLKNNRAYIFGKLIYALSKQFEKTDIIIEDFFKKYSPYIATEYWLNLWENILGIPDDIFFLSTNLDQRRQFILAKLYLRNIYNLDSYYRLAEILGLDISITRGTVENSRLPFKLPQMLLGSSLDKNFIIIIKCNNISKSKLPKILPFSLKSENDNDVIFQKLCDTMKPVDTAFYFKNT